MIASTTSHATASTSSASSTAAAPESIAAVFSETVIDELIDLHDRALIAVFNRAKHKHESEFTRSGKAINEKVRLSWRIGNALMQAKQSGADPFAAIESVLPWEAFIESVTEAEKLGQSEEFDYLRYIGDGYLPMRRYTPELLDVLDLRAAPAAQDVLDAVNVLRAMNANGQRVVPKDAPTDVVRKRWESLVLTDGGVDRRFYELCALSELKNAVGMTTTFMNVDSVTGRVESGSTWDRKRVWRSSINTERAKPARDRATRHEARRHPAQSPALRQRHAEPAR